MHANVLTVKDDLGRLRAEEQERDRTTKSVKIDTALIPALHSNVLTVKDEMERCREAEQGNRLGVPSFINTANVAQQSLRRRRERRFLHGSQEITFAKPIEGSFNSGNLVRELGFWRAGVSANGYRAVGKHCGAQESVR